MNCAKCNTANDPDAAFCSECGTPIDKSPEESRAKSRKVYLYTLLLVPVIILTGALGYYKYFLPGGVAAVVNGEEITLSELDSAVVQAYGSREPADSRLRYQVLNSLITERLAFQEARKAGTALSRQEFEAAVEQTRASWRLDENAFKEQVTAQYGSIDAFEDALRRSILINKFITEKIIPQNADARSANTAVNHWMEGLSARAAVRVTLAEQISGAGCGCCNNRAEAAVPSSDTSVIRTSSQEKRPASGTSKAGKAEAEALRYWHEKNGDDNVTAKSKDFGCHMEIDIIKDGKTIGSLRYQGGRISEY
jgi:predicted nucleic acid-binding Zn ribbon protein